MTSKYYDITVPITSDMLIWPGDPKVTLRQVSSISQGASSNISQLRMSVHTGTHIDAPKHFLDDGNTIDRISLKQLIGPVFVMVFEEEISLITKETITKHKDFDILSDIKKVLFKTRNSRLWHSDSKLFRKDFVGLDHSAAQLLADLGMELVGVDYLSIATFNETEEPHKILLEQGVVLLEGIDLTGVPQGSYELYCLPLLLQGCEGSPARVILKSETNV